MSVEKELKVICKNTYGTDLYYPECHRSQIFADIAGTKTLTPITISYIKKLGYTLVQQGRTL
jgi:hypothetical protein